MLKSLNEWLVIEDKPIAGMEPRILAMVAPWKDKVILAVIDSTGNTSEVTLDYDQICDLEGALHQSWRKAQTIQGLKEKLKSEGMCEHGWTQGNCEYDECRGKN